MQTRYDYKELREFLLPEHKWLYFAIRVLRTNGWIYFLMNTLPVIGTFFISDQAKTLWTVAGTICLALASGFVALKAYRSQSPTSVEEQAQAAAWRSQSPEARAGMAEYEKYK